MKLFEARKAKSIIVSELDKMAKRFNWSFIPVVETMESDLTRGWFGVQIRTDSDSYDEFYDFEPNKVKVERILNKKMGFKIGEHYFEKYGQGILDYY